MQGYQLTFFTQQGSKHRHLPLGEWLIQEAHKLGITGATLLAASEGFGQKHKLHSARFFELGDQPIEVTMAVSAAEADLLFQRLREEKVKVFYTRTVVEYGVTGDD